MTGRSTCPWTWSADPQHRWRGRLRRGGRAGPAPRPRPGLAPRRRHRPDADRARRAGRRLVRLRARGAAPGRPGQPGGVDRRARAPHEHAAGQARGASPAERRAAERVGSVPIRSASFVSIACDAEVVRERGLPLADYFLWNDDFEYTTRLLRGGSACTCPPAWWSTRPGCSARPTPTRGSGSSTRSATRSGSSPAPTACARTRRRLYAGSTARRWVRTWAHSADRATLRRGLVAGVRAGAAAGPRPNATAPGGRWSPGAEDDAGCARATSRS